MDCKLKCQLDFSPISQVNSSVIRVALAQAIKWWQNLLVEVLPFLQIWSHRHNMECKEIIKDWSYIELYLTGNFISILAQHISKLITKKQRIQKFPPQ